MLTLSSLHLAVPVPGRTLPFSLSHVGPAALSEPLGAALRAQWTYGFPTVPKPGLQLTHGFLQYPAGMQAIAAAHLLEVLPRGTILDPFVGGGTTLVEAMRCGRRAVGADASPLALFASAHHTWRAQDVELEELRAQATAALLRVDPKFVPALEQPPSDQPSPADAAPPPAAGSVEAHVAMSSKVRSVPKLERGGAHKTSFRDWAPLRAKIEELIAEASDTGSDTPVANDAPSREINHEALSPLWFCFAAAQQRSERYKYKSPLASFDATVDSYCLALRAFRDVTPDASAASPPRLLLSDARQLSLSARGLPLADGLITSPPYAGVYDYLSHARESRARLGAQGPAPLMGLQGTPDGRTWPKGWRSTNEMGARKQMRKQTFHGEFRTAWEADQRAWLTQARDNLRAGGRAALLIGDGEGGLDALASTSAAAEDVGLIVLASATIVSTVESQAKRQKGKRRPEHAVLLEVPN